MNGYRANNNMWCLLVTCSLILGLTCSIPTPNDVTNTSLVVPKPGGIRQGKACNLVGTCYLTRECKAQGGVAFGSCARRIGKCCVVSRTCGGVVSKSNNTYYRNPGFPNAFTTATKCKISINKITDSVSQIRLSFTQLQLAQPDNTGACVNDFLTITGTDSQVPRICGDNDGQHIYLRFMNDSSPIQLTIVTSSTVTFARKWDILVTQHEISEAAPMGCLQYYTGVSGSVSSFNFGPSRNVNVRTTRQLSSLWYSICVRPEAGYCGIEWSQADLTSFTVSENTKDAEQNNLLGLQASSITGQNCKTDFVIIPSAMQNLQPLNVDRFCGNALLPTRSLTQSMILTVVDNDGDIDDNDNRGFTLTYRQITVNKDMWRLLVTCSLLLGLTCSIQTPNDVTNTSLVVPKPGVRQGFPSFAHLFPFSAAVFRFKQARCTGTNSLIGTCYLARECALEGGTAFGPCARRLGKCCVVSRNCGGSPSKSNHTYYRNPGFPDVYAGGAQCKISIAKMTDSICQIRLQFVRFSLAQPNAGGQCVSDFLTINNADTKMPRICGSNTDQHIYVKFLSDGSPIELSIDTNVAVRFNRQWDILVTQQACNESVPLGCTQYFTGVTGTVTSFNYGTSKNGADTRQLVDQQYTVCVRPEAGYCGIDWSPADSSSFTVSGNTRQLEIDKKLGMVTPMSLTVVTDSTEPQGVDIDNRGFQLNYLQVPCPQNI
ncbi:hypothetical protein B566_EDAN006167 [Ephemera danica]|nr:hypothetical protein B566_EDAN006167 [Ephemera danica]